MANHSSRCALLWRVRSKQRSSACRVIVSPVSEELVPAGVELHYEGAATLGASGRARLHGRVGGIGGMLWEALAAAGWVGEMATHQMKVACRVGVSPPTDEARESSAVEPLPGRKREIVEGGWVDERGVSWGLQVGSLNGRAAGPGYRLLERERTEDDLEFSEDLLYTAAARAGWLPGEPNETVEVPNVDIIVRVTRRAAVIASHA